MGARALSSRVAQANVRLSMERARLGHKISHLIGGEWLASQYKLQRSFVSGTSCGLPDHSLK